MALSSVMCQNDMTFRDKEECAEEECASKSEELLNDLPRLRICMCHKDEGLEHWELTLHCESVAFPRIEPNLRSTSREACFYWHLYAAAAKHLPLYQKVLNQALQRSLHKITRRGKARSCVCFSNELLRLDTLDRLARKNVINKLEELIQMQSTLESVCLEGLSLTQEEGLRLLLALYNSRKTMKYLYCWRAFARTKTSEIVDPDRVCESQCYRRNKLKKCELLSAIGCLESLTTLSMNYSYLATHSGHLLINLSKALGEKWEWLQLLCTEDDFDRDFEYSQYCISLPSTTWNTMKQSSPNLKVQYSIVNVPEYDRHKKFFSKTTPMHTFSLSTRSSQKSRHLYFTDCTMKTLYAWYAETLAYLHLHFWHQRDDMDSHLAKLFLRLPSLMVFEFMGEIRKLKPICAMCCQIQIGQCKVHYVNIQLQKVIHADIDYEKLVKSIDSLLKCFKPEFDKANIKFLVSNIGD